MPRVYQRIRLAIPEFWSEELVQHFNLWLQDMQQGMRPYTPATAKTFERRFILYTRRQWGEQAVSLSIEKAFAPAAVYTALTAYSVESYSNRHNMLYSILSFVRFLVQIGRLDESLIGQLRKFRPKRVVPPRKTVLRDLDGVKKLRNAISTKGYESEYSRTLDRVVIETFIHTGLRLAELCQLNLDNVDLDNQVIYVYLGKGRKNRKVGITKELKPYLEHYLPIRLQRLQRKQTGEKTAFFINRRGTRIKTADITRRMLRLSRHMGYPITPHGLRRTFATLHANNGKPINMIQLALGHSDIRTTQEYLMTDENQVIQAMKDW